MKKTYHIVTQAAKESASIIEQFCQQNGQILLPLVNMIQSASQVVDGVIHEVGIQMLQTILTLSAEQVAGQRTPGKASGEIRWHGSQHGHVKLSDGKVRVKRPRLRHKTRWQFVGSANLLAKAGGECEGIFIGFRERRELRKRLVVARGDAYMQQFVRDSPGFRNAHSFQEHVLRCGF